MTDMKIKLLQKRIDEIVQYITPLLPLANSHMVEFFSIDLWNKFIPKSIVKETRSNGESQAIQAFWKCRSNIEKRKMCGQSSNVVPDRDNHCAFQYVTNFIELADKYYLKPDNILCLPVKEFREQMQTLGASNLQSLKLTEFMSPKKSHEVEILSTIVATLADWKKAEYTVELGGGRGYLATMLNLLYAIPVLNIDRSEINEKGAQERNRKIHKQWPGLVKKADVTITSNSSCGSSDLDNNIDVKDLLPSAETSIKKPDVDNNNILYRHVTKYITQETDISKLLKDCFNCLPDVTFCLTGLHTCGDLGSASLKLFTRCSSALAICTVPCCYHLLTEARSETFLSEKLSSFEDPPSHGFPMSDYLKDFQLGRNARMLASQSIDKCNVTKDVPSLSLYFRALLELLLKKYTNGNITTDGKMKNVAAKCTTFSEYVEHAQIKLNFAPQTIPLSTSELEEFDQEHRHQIDKLTLYYLLRLCLAQVVESLILLDRLLYLLENGFQDSVLVKMFDPAISPRCHAMVSFRK